MGAVNRSVHIPKQKAPDMLTITTMISPHVIRFPVAANDAARVIELPLCRLDRMRGVEKVYDPNEEIFGEGAPADLVYKVVRGTVRNCKSLGNGRRKIDAFRLPGDIFGLETAGEREYSAEAVDDVVVTVMRRNAFAKKAVESDVSSELWRATTAELRRVQEHTLLLVKNAHQRVASFLLEMYRRSGHAEILELSMTRNDIADYLGLTVETVSRAITRFEASGVVELKMSRQIVLRDLRALRELNE
jgi:CRP/FNR family transcriptional regulator, nitrogen fixation regulation protein